MGTFVNQGLESELHRFRAEERQKRMAVEVGTVVQGRVTRLLPYGVLVQLEDGTRGLVRMSEID